ncbi:MAG: MotA/TolQ/ExbB proton channel family protein [Candidatus Eisenbacteria bacterium]
MLTFGVLLKINVGDMIVGSGTVGGTVLAVITVLSIISWAITIDKARVFRRGSRQTKSFLRILPRDFSVLEANYHVRGTQHSGLAHLLNEAALSVKSDLALVKTANDADIPAIVGSAKAAMERASVEVTQSMESRIIFLATAAGIAPFLGLFGTIWGIMLSFMSMGDMGSTSLTVVGPGVATALIATIFGLGAAIPALVAYNYFVNVVRRENGAMQAFALRVAENLTRELQSELHSSKISV